jgi:uncharacterized membrane protein YeaQ/YmgE (transglycosylase-associated protein family)
VDIGIVSWIVVGLFAGILGKLIMPGRDPGGFTEKTPCRQPSE